MAAAPYLEVDLESNIDTPINYIGKGKGGYGRETFHAGRDCPLVVVVSLHA